MDNMNNILETRCPICGKDLVNVPEIHAVEGQLFCSKKCAVEYEIQVINGSLRELAEQWYKDGAEIVSPTDIGLVYEHRWLIRHCGFNIILLSKYRDSHHEELISTEVIGMYVGEVSDELTEQHTGTFKIEY